MGVFLNQQSARGDEQAASPFSTTRLGTADAPAR
jgi:hypothetical protein